MSYEFLPGPGGSDGKESACNAGDLGWEDLLEKHWGPRAGVQPRLIQGVRSGDGVGEDQDTIASIRY